MHFPAPSFAPQHLLAILDRCASLLSCSACSAASNRAVAVRTASDLESNRASTRLAMARLACALLAMAAAALVSAATLPPDQWVWFVERVVARGIAFFSAFAHAARRALNAGR